MRKLRSRERQRVSGLDPLSWSVFVALVVVLLLKRIMDIWGIVTPRDCDEIAVNFLGPTRALDGPIEWFFVIGLLGAALLVVQAADAVAAGLARIRFWLIWSVNLALCGLLVAGYALTWAWFNPGEPQARTIFQIATAIQKPDAFHHVEVPPRKHGDYYDWVWDEIDQTWTNEAIGLVDHYDVVRVCGKPERQRAQLKLVYGERNPDGDLIDDIEASALEKHHYGRVLYDLEGNYLTTLGGRYIQTSTLTRQRDAAYDPDKAAMSPEEAERRWIQHNRWYGFDTTFPERKDFPRIPKDEIDQIVAESWGDERPAWYEAE